MNNFSKITAMLLLITMLIGCFASCDGKIPLPQPQVNESYIANVKITFATNDEKIAAAVSGIKDSSAVLTVDGQNMKLVRSTVLASSSVDESYILVDDVLYHKLTATVGEYSVTEAERCLMNEENKDYLLSELGIGANINFYDFMSQDVEEYGDVCYYTCTEILEESKESLAAIVEGSFAPYGGVVSLDEVEYFVTMNGENIVDKTLSCHFSILLDGQIYKVTMHIEYSYDYDALFVIESPDNIGEYTEVSCKEMFS